jgi:hypothetical protein
MSVPSESGIDPHDGTEGERGHHKENESENVFFLFRPIAYLQYAAKQAEKYNHEYDQNGRFAHPVRAWYFKTIANRAFRWFSVGVLVVAFTAYLCWLRFFDPAQTQAFFAGILCVLAIVQWTAIYKQWAVMRDQHDAMREQIDVAKQQLEIANLAVKQTDKTIEQMQIDNRAWLVVAVIFQNVVENKNLAVSIIVKNTGKTPGRITRITWEFFFNPREKFEEFASAADSFIGADRKTVIAPGVDSMLPLTLGATDVRFRPHDITVMNSGEWILGAAGKMTYFDVSDQPRYTTWCCSYNPALKQASIYQTGNEMT